MTKFNKLACVLTKYSYGEKKYGLSPEYNAIYKPLKKKYKNLKFYNSLKFKNINQNNIELIKFCKKNKPDLLYFSIYNFEFYIETLIYLKNELGIKLINWSSDDSWRFNQHSKIISQYLDVMITTSIDAHKYYNNNNKKSILASWGCPDHWFQKPKKHTECKRDIIFIGQRYFDREKFITRLKEKFNVECYGKGWSNPSLKDSEVSNYLRDSKISLNFSKSRGKKKQTKARIFEICGSGGFCLTENSPELGSFYSNSELDYFTNTTELLDKIEKYLKNGKLRDKLAIKANKKTKIYSYTRIQKKIINRLKKFNLVNNNRKKINKNFLDIFNQFVFIFFIKIFYNLLKIFFKKNITIKILRRFFFEIEWRIRGEKTYSKVGACNNYFKSY